MRLHGIVVFSWHCQLNECWYEVAQFSFAIGSRGVSFRAIFACWVGEWRAETYAAFRSLVSTAKANRASVLEGLRFVLAIKLPTKPVPGVG
jgi:hypothetical protein